MIKLVLK